MGGGNGYSFHKYSFKKNVVGINDFTIIKLKTNSLFLISESQREETISYF